MTDRIKVETDANRDRINRIKLDIADAKDTISKIYASCTRMSLGEYTSAAERQITILRALIERQTAILGEAEDLQSDLKLDMFLLQGPDGLEGSPFDPAGTFP